MSETYYLAHNTTAGRPGQFLGIFSSFSAAKEVVAVSLGRELRDLEEVTDWGHFVRRVTIDEWVLGGIMALPKVNVRGG